MKNKWKTVGRVLGRVGICLGTLVAAIGITLLLALNMICSANYPNVQRIFVTTILETGQLKFLASWFLA